MAERPFACREWQEDLAAWVVAQIEPECEVLLDAHLATCAVCRSEAESLLEVSAVLLATPGPDGPATTEADPPAELGDRIWARIASERRTRRALAAGLVAVAGAAAAVVLVVALERGPEPARLSGQEVAFAVVPAGAEVAAVLGDDEGGSVVQLTATGLDPATTYALWMSPPDGGWDDRVPAGTFRADGDGDVDVLLRCAYPSRTYARVWATTPEGDIALDTKGPSG